MMVCTNVLNATDELHELYNKNAGSMLSDVDFIIEDENNFIFVEYKNSAVSGASAPNAFQPSQDTSVKKIARKFYDSLHYLRLIAQEGGKSLDYVYILEYPNGDSITRKLIRDKIAKYLPFAIQNAIQKKHSSTKTIIRELMVLSIAEWNKLYPKYPLVANNTGEPQSPTLPKSK